MIKNNVIAVVELFLLIGITNTCSAQQEQNQNNSSSGVHNGHTVFYGNFQKGDFLHFYYLDSIDNPQGAKILFKTDNNYQKSFSNEWLLQRIFNEGNTPITYLFFPGDSIRISTGASNYFTLSYNKGTRNSELIFCKEMIMAFGPLSPYFINRDSGYLFNIENIKKVYTKRTLFLEKAFTEKKISSLFKNAYADIIFYRQITDEIYPVYYNLKIEDYLKTASHEMRKLFRRDSLLVITEYRLAAWNYLKLMAKIEYGKISPENLINTAAKTFEGITKEYLLAKIVQEFEINSKGLAVSLPVKIKDFKPGYYADYIKANMLRAKSKTFSGLLATNGDNVFLEKILFQQTDSLTVIDFWASWCIPCRDEMRFYPNRMNELGKEKVRFIFISMDKDVSAWLSSARDYPFITATNSFLLLSNFDSDFAKKYFINSIPRYMLIGKDGKIIHSDASRPSDNNFKAEVIKELLKGNQKTTGHLNGL
ncbi:TlpA family protein disulfide reductase [Ferruginibacter sp.]